MIWIHNITAPVPSSASNFLLAMLESAMTLTSEPSWHISVEIGDAEIKAFILPLDFIESPSVYSYAFYLFRNGKRVDTRWYQNANHVTFALDLAGHYRVAGFVAKNDQNNSSKPIGSASVWIPPVLSDPACIDTSGDPAAFLLSSGGCWEYECILFPGNPGDGLFVLMPSAAIISKPFRPHFDRVSRAASGLFPGVALCLADPRVSKDATLKTSWMIGNTKNPMGPDLASLVTRIAKRFGIPNNKICFWGSSAGGFAALLSSSYLECSTAVSINGQSNISAYADKDSVSKAINLYCEDEPIGSAKLDSDVFDLRGRLFPESISRAILVQNKDDYHHYHKHYLPLWSHLGGVEVNGYGTTYGHSSYTYVDHRGHCAETIGMTKLIIADLLRT